MCIRVLCIDDNPMMMDLIRYALLLERETFGEKIEIFTAFDGIQGLDCILRHKPDIVLLDVKMPGLTGYEVLELLRSNESLQHIGVIIVSMGVQEDAQLRGFDLGADDYVTKPFNPKLLVARIKAVLQRKRNEYRTDGKGNIHYASVEVDQTARQAYRGHHALDLTAREFDLLLFFLRHPHQVLSRDTIIEHVWGFDYEGDSENIVDVYIGYLRKKLEVQGPRLIHTVRGVGFVLKQPHAGE